MKTIKTLLAGLLALALISAAEAQSRVHITGSSAFRANAYEGIQSILASGYTYAYSGPSLPLATRAIFNGTVNGNAVIIKTNFTGSEAGIQTVSNNQAITFIGDRAGTTGGEPNISDTTDSKVPDIAFSDTYQSSSFFFGTYRGVNYPTLNSTNKTTGLTDQIIGIVAFKFAITEGSDPDLANITTAQARNLFTTGNPSLALFTGNAADEPVFDPDTGEQTGGGIVYATGRDFGSGTRLTLLAEIGLGSRATVKQYEPRNAGGRVITNSAITSFVPWPAGNVNGVPYNAFNGGYNSGNEASRAIASTTPVGTQAITLVGFDDFNLNTLPGNGRELSYNGVLLGNDLETGGVIGTSALKIANGLYTLWGYQHLYYRDNTAGVQKDVADRLALRIKDVTAPRPRLSEMRVSRTTDGAVVTQTY